MKLAAALSFRYLSENPLVLQNLLGIRLLIFVGDCVPLPAPYEVTCALQQLDVTNDSGQGDGFQITFNLARSGLADYALLQNGTVDPMKRINISVLLGAVPEVLSDTAYDRADQGPLRRTPDRGGHQRPRASSHCQRATEKSRPEPSE